MEKSASMEPLKLEMISLEICSVRGEIKDRPACSLRQTLLAPHAMKPLPRAPTITFLHSLLVPYS